jgi:TonB family protein
MTSSTARRTTLVLALLCAAPARAAGATAQQPQAPSPPPADAAGSGGAAPGAKEPVLATPPALRQLVPADLPPGTAFPAPSVDVILAIDVAASGVVEEVRLEQGAGEPFDGAALAAARKFLFEPGRLDTGEPVPVTVSFRFTMTAPPPPPAAEAAAPPAPVRLAGRLLERGTRRPLPDAAVQVRTSGAPLRASTGPDGRFVVEVAEPVFTLVAAPAGHERLEVRIEARPGEERDETYYLERTGTGFETTVRAEAVRREITRQVIPAAEVARVPGSQGDTIRAVLNLPGAARPSFGGGAIILRGSSPGDSRFFVEGQEIPLLYHFGGLRSAVNPRFLEAVEFVPGNFAPDFGRATGGIIDVKLRDPAGDLLRGDASFSLYAFGASLEGPVGGGWSVGGAFHRSWIDTLLPLLIPEDANLSFDTAPRYYDYQFLASKELGSQKLRLTWYGSMDKLVLVFERPTDDPKITGRLAARTMFHALQVRLAGQVAPRLRHDSSVQLGWQEFRTQFGPEFFFDLGGLAAAVRSAWTLDLASGLAARAGLDADVVGVTIDANVPQPPKEGEVQTPVSTSPTFSVKKSAGQRQPAGFAELRWEPTRGLVVLPGVRVDWFSQIERLTVDPRFTVRGEVAPGTTLKGGVGLFHQPPQPDEADEAIGTPRLLAPRAVHWSGGLERRLLDGLDADVVGFFKSLSRLVVRNPASSFDPTAPRYLNEGTGRVYGLEATVKARFGERFFGWVAYTYQRAFRRDRPDLAERRFDFDQPHILTALGTWTFNEQLSAGARFRLVSGNPTTPVGGSVLDAGSGTYVPVYGATNSARLPAFWALDLRVDRTWTWRTWKLGAYLDVQNVTNHENVEGYSYSYDYARRSPATGLPILPILGVQAEW